MDFKKQIDYWINTAEDDFGTSEYLLSGKRILQGLFFCHLTIEKAIKAHVTRCIKNIPPKSHNLANLLKLTDLELSEDDKDFCAILMAYQLEGRYPEYYPKAPSLKKAEEYFKKTRTLFQWLKTKL